jgi:predicted HicB family RNase H-like nuclease
MTYLHYKGYTGTIEPQLEDNSLFGKLVFIRDLVTYEAQTLAELKKEFEFSVDVYLQSCEELGRKPETPFKGSFNVRSSPDIHRQIVLAASQEDMSLNAFVNQAIMEKLARHHATH